MYLPQGHPRKLDRRVFGAVLAALATALFALVLGPAAAGAEMVIPHDPTHAVDPHLTTAPPATAPPASTAEPAEAQAEPAPEPPPAPAASEPPAAAAAPSPPIGDPSAGSAPASPSPPPSPQTEPSRFEKAIMGPAQCFLYSTKAWLGQYALLLLSDYGLLNSKPDPEKQDIGGTILFQYNSDVASAHRWCQTDRDF